MTIRQRNNSNPQPAVQSAPGGKRPDLKPDPSIPSKPLTEPRHVRAAASELYNRYHRLWGNNASASQVRALASLLSLTRVVMRDVELAGRIAKLEEERARLGSTDEELGADSAQAPAVN